MTNVYDGDGQQVKTIIEGTPNDTETTRSMRIVSPSMHKFWGRGLHSSRYSFSQ